MSPGQVTLLIALAVLAGIWAWTRVLVGRDAARAADEFRRDFPGRCMTCSLDGYAKRELHITSGLPTPHHCVERGRWVGPEE